MLVYIEFTEEAVELLLMCLMDAKRFLSPKHMLMGEIEDHLARGYASLGTVPFSSTLLCRVVCVSAHELACAWAACEF